MSFEEQCNDRLCECHKKQERQAETKGSPKPTMRRSRANAPSAPESVTTRPGGNGVRGRADKLRFEPANEAMKPIDLKSDFHAKPVRLQSFKLGSETLGRLFYYAEDVEAEREHYQKEIEYWKDQDAKWLKENERMTEVNRSFIKRAEVAEKETIRLNGLLMTADGVKETLAKRAEKAEDKAEAAEKRNAELEIWLHMERNDSKGWNDRAEKAEARVAELEAELKRERNWSKYETKQVKERDKKIKALAGEKTK